jgi:transcriptional regulator with XRE-family HTH domain
MKHQGANNYLKAYRKKSGLSQREIANLLGYRNKAQVSRHERAASVPSLTAALAYEVIFSVPVAALFATLHDSVKQDIEIELRTLREALEGRSAHASDANLTAHKLTWLADRTLGQTAD